MPAIARDSRPQLAGPQTRHERFAPDGHPAARHPASAVAIRRGHEPLRCNEATSSALGNGISAVRPTCCWCYWCWHSIAPCRGPIRANAPLLLPALPRCAPSLPVVTRRSLAEDPTLLLCTRHNRRRPLGTASQHQHANEAPRQPRRAPRVGSVGELTRGPVFGLAASQGK